MNIFATDLDPIGCARALADLHLKAALECAQLVSTTLRALGLDAPHAPTGPKARAILPGELYRTAYPNHPITRWVGMSRANFTWTVDHGLALCDEYVRRFGTQHRSRPALETARDLSGMVADGPLLPFAVDVPKEWRDRVDMTGSPCEVYRQYLRVKYAVWGLAARWTRTAPPDWL